MNTQDRSPLEWTDWISLQSRGLSRVFSNTTVQKHQFFGAKLQARVKSGDGRKGRLEEPRQEYISVRKLSEIVGEAGRIRSFRAYERLNFI